MRTQLVSYATVDEPVSIAEARVHLNQPENMQDSEILFFIQSAKEQVEHKLGRKLMSQTWEGALDAFPGDYIELPYVPVASITSVEYYDTANVRQTVPITDYSLDTSGQLSRILLGYNKSWPSTLSGIYNAVLVTFVTGYPNANAIPQSIKHWMKLFISEARIHKDLTTDREVILTPWAERLLDPYRLLSV